MRDVPRCRMGREVRHMPTLWVSHIAMILSISVTPRHWARGARVIESRFRRAC